MRELLSLYWIFLKIGSVTFGGGYAMLPILQREFSDQRHWVSDEELMDYFAIGQCTPGIIAINVSTFIGHKKKGIIGGIVATLGFVTIPMLLLIGIAAFFQNFASLKIISHALAGVRVVVCVLILNAVERLWKKSVIDTFSLGIFLAIFSLSLLTTISPAILVILAAIVGITISELRKEKKS